MALGHTAFGNKRRPWTAWVSQRIQRGKQVGCHCFFSHLGGKIAPEENNGAARPAKHLGDQCRRLQRLRSASFTGLPLDGANAHLVGLVLAVGVDVRPEEHHHECQEAENNAFTADASSSRRRRWLRREDVVNPGGRVGGGGGWGLARGLGGQAHLPAQLLAPGA